MLIPSERHTHADLRLWVELEAADRVHGKRAEKRAFSAMSAVQEFAANGPCFVSISCGKDSVVALHLTRRAGIQCPVVHLRACDPWWCPGNAEVLDAISEWAGVIDVVEISYPPQGDMQPIEWDRACDRAWRQAIREAHKVVGTERMITGIRAQESRTRRLRCERWGTTTTRTCAPLARWSARDVFGYLAHHNLPAHPSYAMLGGGRWNRDWLRVDELGGDQGTGMGRKEWEQEYYGDTGGDPLSAR